MILPIYTYGEEILRKKAEDVNLEDEEIQHVIDNMFETMTNANGAGLAAPQIGLNKKIIVKAHKFSKEAINKIESAGGKAEVI